MGSLKGFVLRLAGLGSAVSTVIACGRLIIYLVFGLVAVLALTGTFGRECYRDPAQKVLAILLGRKLPPDADWAKGRRSGRFR